MRTQLKDWARQQLEARIQLVQQSVREQTGLYARRRDIIEVLEAQMERSLSALEMGFMQSSFSREEIEERVNILDELIAELRAVPETETAHTGNHAR